MIRKTRYVILGLLREEKLTGYEIKKSIDNRMRFFWQESYGQIYPELMSLMRDEMIREVIPKSTEIMKREKIRYEITDKGLVELKQWMETDNEKDTVRSEALLKFYLAADENKQEIKQHLQTFNRQRKEQLLLFERFREQLFQDIDLHNNHKYILEVLELGIKEQELYCNWSEQFTQKLLQQEGDK
jgi:DNA-binding PadR family transcriptional regulator